MTPTGRRALAPLLLLLAACGGGDTSPTTATAPAAAAPVACAAPVAAEPGPAGPADWPVYGRAGDRHGVDTASGPASRLRPLWGLRLDGSIFAQPLVYRGLVVAATEHDTVYALDAATGCVVWRTSLGQSFLACSANDPAAPCTGAQAHRLDCGNLPEVGVTSTPAIDTATGTVYVVAYLEPGRFEMVALDLAGGAVRWRHPIDLPGSEVLYQLSRPAVALANGRAYASFGGRAGDCRNYHGFVIGVRLDGAGPDDVFQVSPARQGAVWAPGGPVMLPNGDLLVASGNTVGQGRWDGANAVFRLSPRLLRLDYFAPSNWAYLSRSDLDTGSVSPTLVDGGLVFQVGKDGRGYLLNADHLGGVGGQVYGAALIDSPPCFAIGATAYRSPLVYVPCDHGLAAVRLSGSRFSLAWRGPDFVSGSPIVAGGLVWDVDYTGGHLYGLDPAGGAVRQKVEIGAAEHFVAPSASAGRLLVPAGRRLLAFSFG